MRFDENHHDGVVDLPNIGFYGGWTGIKNAPQNTRQFSSPDKSLHLLISGEVFTEINGREVSIPNSEDGTVLLRQYEESGDIFVESLNGIFSILILDLKRNKILLCNDRFGAERLYVHESDSDFYFASEAKAILSVASSTREFDQTGLGQYLAFGCTLGSDSLFKGIEVLPGGTCCTISRASCNRRSYFTPKDWECQSPLSSVDFEKRFDASLKQLLPKYFDSSKRIGISLTAGLDTRMIMAFLDPDPEQLVSFTYSGEDVDPLDARIATKIAEAVGIEHHNLRIGPDFFSDFSTHAEQTVRATDGCFGITGAHEVYMSRIASGLAPTRLTGNYGSEILRGVSTFKPLGLPRNLIAGEIDQSVQQAKLSDQLKDTHPVTFAAFKETPWSLYGNLSAGRSLLNFRTPYLDNAFVKLAYQGPRQTAAALSNCCGIVRQNSPRLARIPTNRAYLGTARGINATLRQAFAKVTFKLDYINNEGFPNALSGIEQIYTAGLKRFGLLGLHKHLHYRSWFKDRLSNYVLDQTGDQQLQRLDFLDTAQVRKIAKEHVDGKKNHVETLNLVMTLQLIDQIFLRPQSSVVTDSRSAVNLTSK